MLEGAVVVTNGAGFGHDAEDVDFVINGNSFVINDGATNDLYKVGIYLSGKETGIGWRLASIALPEITGNTFSEDYLIYLRTLDDDALKAPSRIFVDDFIASNITGDYALRRSDGDPQLNPDPPIASTCTTRSMPRSAVPSPVEPWCSASRTIPTIRSTRMGSPSMPRLVRAPSR